MLLQQRAMNNFDQRETHEALSSAFKSLVCCYVSGCMDYMVMG